MSIIFQLGLPVAVLVACPPEIVPFTSRGIRDIMVYHFREVFMKKRFSEEQIVGVLQEQLAGVSVVEICKKYNLSQACFYKWKKKYGELNVSEAKRLKAL